MTPFILPHTLTSIWLISCLLIAYNLSSHTLSLLLILESLALLILVSTGIATISSSSSVALFLTILTFLATGAALGLSILVSSIRTLNMGLSSGQSLIW